MSTLELDWLRNNRSGGFAPESGAAAFRDLLIFEERLKQNAARLHKRKHKYQCKCKFMELADGSVLVDSLSRCHVACLRRDQRTKSMCSLLY